jgi:hypothetical protein
MILGKKKKGMKEQIKKYAYISVRDTWTKNMFEYITDNTISPVITPDPVFAFNQNINKDILSKDEIIRKFTLPEKYILFSFHTPHTVSASWLTSFMDLAAHDGYSCVALRMPEGIKFSHPFEHEISSPLSPIDWYYLIKYSYGYIGHNMHPIIVCLHNAVPFFSFDQYVKRSFFFFTDRTTSKIYHILSAAGLQNNAVSSLSFTFKKPYTSNSVYKSILSFDKSRCTDFAKRMYNNYTIMMSNILKSL